MEKPPQTEAQIQKAILDRLAYSKLLHWRQNVGGIPARLTNGVPVFKRNPMKGFPDLAGVVMIGGLGVLWTMEVKTVKGFLSKEQKLWDSELQSRGVYTAIVRSVEEADAFICFLEKLQVKYKANNFNLEVVA